MTLRQTASQLFAVIWRTGSSFCQSRNGSPVWSLILWRTPIMMCDFCNALNPVWRFRAEPFVVDYGPMVGASDADWAACSACRDLILADDRNGLVDRAMLIAPVIPDLAESELRELRRWSHGLFFAH